MGEKQSKLAQLLRSELVTLPVPKHGDIAASPYADALHAVYTGLGGIQTQELLKTRVGAWDMQFNGIAMEFDEEQHFNRYRTYTLTSSIYKPLSQFPLSLYERYCATHENACLRKASHGGYWTKENCERQFGVASTRGDLTGDGASRWKQRAFYDFIKDLSPLVLGFNVVRVAIWDTVSLAGRQMTVENALKYSGGEARNAIIELIEQRSYQTFPLR